MLPHRQRSWISICLVTCGVTVILGYIPYIILGHGRAVGFFTTYVSEYSWNGGGVLLLTQWLNQHLQFNGVIAHILSYSIDLLLVGGIALAVWWQRLHEHISMEAATLILIGTIFSVSTHVFPWYNPALLPWVALLARPIWTKRGGLNAKGLATVMTWYFVCASISAYFVTNNSYWPIYYLCVYDPVIIVLGIAVFVGFKRSYVQRIES